MGEWSLAGAPAPKDDASEAIDVVVDDPAAKDEQAAQVIAARAAAALLVPHVGRPGDRVSIHVAGRAHPGHGPHPDGHADEFVTVTVAANPSDAEVLDSSSEGA